MNNETEITKANDGLRPTRQPHSKSYPSIKHRHSARVTYPNKNQYEKAESEYVTRDFS